MFDQLFAPCLLGETLGKMELFATLIIIGGIALTTSSSIGAATPKLVPCQLVARYTSSEVVIISVALVVVMLCMMFLIHMSKYRPRSLNALIPVFYAFVAGGWGAIMNATLKAVGEIIQSAGSAVINPWTTLIPYLQIIFCIFGAVLMISYINQGLGNFDAVVFLPLYNCLYIVLSSTYGGIFYIEFGGMTQLGLILFSIGIVTTFIGVGLLSLRGHKIENIADLKASIRDLPLELASAGDVNIEELPVSPEERRKAFLNSSRSKGWIVQDENLLFLGGSVRGFHHDVGRRKKRNNRLHGAMHAVTAAGSGAAHAVAVAGGTAMHTVAHAGTGAAHAVAHAGSRLVTKKNKIEPGNGETDSQQPSVQDDSEAPMTVIDEENNQAT